MKIAVIGQSVFGEKVYSLLRAKGHEVVGVFTIPDKNGRPDVLAAKAQEDGVQVFKFPRWRLKGQIIPEVLLQYESCGAELNVLAFCSQYIPMEVIEAPKHQSIIYHPSLLPKHRGASAISWTLIQGDEVGGFSIFYADHGLDTGPILLQKEVKIDPDDTLNSLYRRFMMPEGITAMGEAVELIAAGKAPKVPQPKEGASYEAHITAKPELAELDWTKTAAQLHNFIRGCDKVPGAWATVEGQTVKFFGSKRWTAPLPTDGSQVRIEGMHGAFATVHKDGLILVGSDGGFVNVTNIEVDGKPKPASKFGQAEEARAELTLTEDEAKMRSELAAVWKSILNLPDIPDDVDFFKAGAGSMDVTRLVEEVKDKCGGLELEPEAVYQGPAFGDFVHTVISLHRSGGSGGPKTVEYRAVELSVNKLELRFPAQLFIDGVFVDAEGGRTYETINPADESVICEVAKGGAADVEAAVQAAKRAFEEGDWAKLSARERGRLLYRLADLMEEHKEELATLESLDSGAVYTLALKTHIGMSIDTWRYFAGWCDKIQGSTVPISHARPNRNLTIVKKEPIGVVALVTPWNYPLMMLSWKMAACLAAGNTVIHKPAQVSPLTALKFAELSVLAGVPPGVINVLPGSGREIGQLLAEHRLVRKIGFTGSTPVGATIMRTAAESNLKKVSLELGGKSPLIIFADADLDKAVRQACGAVFFNKGENCIAAGRLFVSAAIHDEFVARVTAEAGKMAIGDPLDRGTAHGPQNHRAHLEKLVAYCERGVKEGAKLVCGGKQLDRPGLFFMPTIFTEVSDDNFIASEESFGPIMIISTFEEEDVAGVLKRANASEYGLASGVFSKDVSKVLRVAEALEAGTVFVNCYNKTDVAAPFGGFKQSGFGKDLGQAALDEYLRSKTITIEY